MTDVSQPTPTPPQAPPPPAAPATPPHLEKLAGQMEGVESADKAALDQRNAAMLKPMSALSSINASPMPQPPAQQKPPPAPNAGEYQKDAMAFASAMAVLGAVAGRFTRAPGGAALNAFGAALKGWQSGNLQAYENAAKEWEQNTKATVENNRQVMEKYRLALANRKMNIDEQMSQVQLISAQYHDQIMYDAAAAKNYTMVAQIYEKQHEYTEKVKDSAAKLQEKRDEQKTKNEQSATYWLSPEGQQRLEGLPPSQQASVKQMIDIYADKNKKPQNAALNRFLEENPNATAQEIQHFQQQARPPRSAPAMALAKFMEEHPNATAEEIQKFQSKQAGMNSEARAFGTTVGNLKTIIHAAYSAIPRAEELSAIVPRTGFVPMNKLIQMGEQNITDPNLKKFYVANLNVAELWAKAMNVRGVMRESDRDLALKGLYTADTPENYRAALSELKTFLQREELAVKEARDDMPLGSLTGGGGAGGGSPAPAPPGGGGGGWTVEKVK